MRAGTESLELGMDARRGETRGAGHGSLPGYRPYVVTRRERESDTISSFYLVPGDGGALAPFAPGQHLALRLEIPGREEPTHRSYSLSERPGSGYYRITVKREDGRGASPPGLASNYLHREVHRGFRLWARGPQGGFQLDPSRPAPVALLSAGVGLAPMIGMLNALVSQGARQPVWFIHGARNGREHALGAEVRRIAAAHPNVQVHVRYSRPAASDRIGVDYDSRGHVDGALVRQVLPHLDFDFFLCGPPAFTDALRAGLAGLGVAGHRVRHERFTGGGVGAALAARGTPAPPPAVGTSPVLVRFTRSGVTARWDGTAASLLELAEAKGLKPDSACRAGICQICSCRLLAGEVDYVTAPAERPGTGSVLPCCARPVTEVALDL